MSAPTFGPVPRSFFDGNLPQRSPTARCNLRQLDQQLRWGALVGHAQSSWGYTVLRTAYTPEADELFRIAIARLKSYVHYWCHYDRFLSYGARCEERCGDFAEHCEEVFRRFHLDVVEDREGLAHLDGNGDGSVDDRFTALQAYFLRWRAGVKTGANFNPRHTNNPRFCLCLILDSESIASLAQLPEELPPLRPNIRDPRELDPKLPIDDVYNAVAACDDSEQRLEGEKIADELVELKDEIHHDRALTRISTSFSLSTYWKSYDVFAKQKIKTFRCARPAVLELAARYRDQVTQLRTQPTRDREADKLGFIEMCKISLWGNHAELSLLTTPEDVQRSRSEAEKHILVDDIAAAYARFQHTRDFPRQPNGEILVDIVLNKAGFELYTDLILAGYLLSAGLATTVVLHPKSIPWFVWDALPSDLDALLAALAAPRHFYETPTDEEQGQGLGLAGLTDEEGGDLEFVFEEWSRFRAEGKLVLRPDRVWTGPGCYWRLCVEAGSVVESLCDGHLAIFKGDLNYRKLVGDVAWDPTMPFEDAIGVLGPGQGIDLLSLRTCKSDVVVGLEPGEDERLKGMEGGGGDSGARKWAWSGKWTVACFSGS
ncbi:hypothetical protein NEMBOFW57_010749 [Staphylotrichum longicolle]|uniref:Sugar phosphate phosphatase n=1 Tax=Staphylotrichum longicolle TaxID=669026 RepID=A0AAD4ENJ8_9PEZI|nr:hypothetical protein NEMBOFW57_010749 [Staphylotrichum longicolle]